MLDRICLRACRRCRRCRRLAQVAVHVGVRSQERMDNRMIEEAPKAIPTYQDLKKTIKTRSVGMPRYGRILEQSGTDPGRTYGVMCTVRHCAFHHIHYLFLIYTSFSVNPIKGPINTVEKARNHLPSLAFRQCH
jgi:hypothetical protein